MSIFQRLPHRERNGPASLKGRRIVSSSLRRYRNEDDYRISLLYRGALTPESERPLNAGRGICFLQRSEIGDFGDSGRPAGKKTDAETGLGLITTMALSPLVLPAPIRSPVAMHHRFTRRLALAWGGCPSWLRSPPPHETTVTRAESGPVAINQVLRNDEHRNALGALLRPLPNAASATKMELCCRSLRGSSAK